MNIVEKWTPIFDALKVTDEKKRKFMAEYAEHHTKMDFKQLTHIEPKKISEVFPYDENNEDLIWVEELGKGGENADLGQNLLPISLKVLSDIKFENKNVELKRGLEIKSFRFKLDKSWIMEYKLITGKNWVIQVESILLKYLSDAINKELETKDNLYVESMCSMLSLKNEGTKNEPIPVLVLYSKYQVD